MLKETFTRFHKDTGGLIYAERIQDVEDIIRRNHSLRGEKQKFAGSWRHIGEIPNIVIEKWMNDDGVNVLALRGDEFGNYIKKKLRDPDNAAWCVVDGRI